jgi:hypothetical protein
MKPTRTVITRAPHRSVGAIHEPWYQTEPIQHESRLEKQCIEILLLTPCVVRIESQPLTVAFEIEGKPRSYTPDLRITLTDGSQALVEAKGRPYERQFRELLDLGLREALLAHELPLYLAPNALISEDRAERVSELRSMARRTPPPGAIEALVDWVTRQHLPGVGDAEQAGHPLAHIAYAVGRRLLSVGPSFDLSPQQPLQLMAVASDDMQVDLWLGGSIRAENVTATSSNAQLCVIEE